jgi:PIN domain nuclease of toxin-antitoxin system
VKFLLDTHLLVWAFSGPRRLPSSARELIEAAENSVFFSIANVWEVAIKRRLGRAEFAMAPRGFTEAAREMGFTELPIGAEACFQVGDLPLHHRDPFDRMLVAQAMTAPMFLLTVDRQLAAYSHLVRLVA